MKPKSIVFFSLLAIHALPTLAALGAAPDELGTQGSRYVGYSVNDIVMVSGTVIREYISPASIVFGVGWNGPTMPDLQRVLGSSAGEVTAAANTPNSGRTLNITTGTLVLHSGGHMRFFRGNAYIPLLVPVGVSPDNIN